jgi:hypothetical protein
MVTGAPDLNMTSCPTCGCPRWLWPNRNGYAERYCCGGCAAGGQCTCGAAASVGPRSTTPVGSDDSSGPGAGPDRMDTDDG